MSKSLNRHEIIGYLGGDPKIIDSEKGPIASFSVATSNSWSDKNTDEKKERTDWHNVVCFGSLAKIVSKYLEKGAQVYLSGRSQTRRWEDKENNTKYTTEIVASELVMLGKKEQETVLGEHA